MMTNEAELRRRAVARAVVNGGAAAVTRLELGVYRVKSATRRGVTHRVVVTTDGHWWCSCEAGVSGKAVCWHRAAVYIAKLERNSGVRVVGPAAPLAPAATAKEAAAVRRAFQEEDRAMGAPLLAPAPVRHPRKQVAL